MERTLKVCILRPRMGAAELVTVFEGRGQQEALPPHHMGE